MKSLLTNLQESFTFQRVSKTNFAYKTSRAEKCHCPSDENERFSLQNLCKAQSNDFLCNYPKGGLSNLTSPC